MKVSILLQHIAPKQLITQLAGQFASKPYGALTTAVIRWFIKRYDVNMQEAVHTEAADYKTFNSFFTRALKETARPVVKADFISPVDGAISQLGAINKDQIFQSKGHHYSTNALVGNNPSLANDFENGHFACLYLSPKDYHRIHMPCDGKLRAMTYVPGDLYSVNPTTAANVSNLFARNERVVCEFSSEVYGTFVMVLVGATIVGSMATKWHGIVNPPRTRNIRTWQYDEENIVLKQGEEMGQFLLGSTVVLLFKANTIDFNTQWSSEQSIKVGEAMGSNTV